MSHRRLAAAFVLAVLPALAHAQPLPPPLPPRGPSPLLFVRFDGPPGARVTFYQGQAQREFPVPAVAGFRPGYIYRLKLSNLPDRPAPRLAPHPKLEVRASLCPPPRIQAQDHPAPFPVGEGDVTRALGGTLITKVVYLENPEKAVPTATRPGQILETAVAVNQSPLMEAG